MPSRATVLYIGVDRRGGGVPLVAHYPIHTNIKFQQSIASDKAQANIRRSMETCTSHAGICSATAWARSAPILNQRRACWVHVRNWQSRIDSNNRGFHNDCFSSTDRPRTLFLHILSNSPYTNLSIPLYTAQNTSPQHNPPPLLPLSANLQLGWLQDLWTAAALASAPR